MFVCCAFQLQDIIDKTDGYAVLRRCPEECAAQLRVSEKHFVADHAQSLAQKIGYRSCLSAGLFSHGQASTISGMTLRLATGEFEQLIRASSSRSGFDPMSMLWSKTLMPSVRGYLYERQRGPRVWLAERGESCSSSWGLCVSWGTNFQRDKPINPQIAQLHIFMYTLSTCWAQLQGCVLTSGQVQTISNLACWRVHLRLLQEETWFHDLSPEDARSWADAGGVANLSEVVSGKQWMRGDLYIDSDSSPWAQPLCCPLSFFIPGFSCASLQISSIEISYLLLFGSLNLSFVPDARNTWLVSTQAVRWIILLPPFWAGSHTYGFVRNFGISENFFVEIHKFASCTRFVFIVASCWMPLVPFKQTMSWLFCP